MILIIFAGVLGKELKNNIPDAEYERNQLKSGGFW
jgi:hypothetical protein